MRKVIRAKLNILIPLVLLFPIYFALYKIYIPHINAFGCFDDCNNFMGGYFLLLGRHIYSDFFFNHQPLSAYISFIIQLLTHPQNIFELVLRHRQFILIFGFLFDALLILRFGIKALLYIIFYEFTKFYLFGDRFLSEAMIVYPLVYITGALFEKLSNRKVLSIDYFLIPIFAWFVVFSREPYVPLAIFLLALTLYSNKIDRSKITSFCLFIFLSLLTIFTVDIKEYFFNVMMVNYMAVLPADINAAMPGSRLLQIFFYPIYILFYGVSNLFRQVLIFLDLVFLINLAIIIKIKHLKRALLILIILGLANFRVVLPGTTFYSAFHMLVWFSLFIYITIELIFANNNKLLIKSFVFLLLFFSLVFIVSPSYFAKDEVNEHTEFLTNYGLYLQQGEVVKILSNPSDTLFLDGSDDLIYWQAKRNFSYKYSWYTSAMVYFSKYNDARNDMFKNAPPDFYREFGSCPKEISGNEPHLPKFAEGDYLRLYENNKPSCLFVRKEKLKQISDKQWSEAAKWLYTKQ